MASLTVRDLDDSLKRKLRLRAASRNRSMEEEVRQILRAALDEPVARSVSLAARIRARFEPLGGIDLPLAAREPVRLPPAFEPAAAPIRKPARRRR